MARAREARASLWFTESEASKFGFLERWRVAFQKREALAAEKRRARALFNESVSSLFARAQAGHWSQRRLAAKLAIPETTLRRIRDGKVNPRAWLPKLQAALNRLTPS
jgi:ribosome-binding protein aMBF1 (putative translation factor)